MHTRSRQALGSFILLEVMQHIKYSVVAGARCKPVPFMRKAYLPHVRICTFTRGEDSGDGQCDATPYCEAGDMVDQEQVIGDLPDLGGARKAYIATAAPPAQRKSVRED